MRKFVHNMREKLPKRFFASTTLIAVLYVAATAYLMNVSLVNDTLFGPHSWGYRFDLLTALFFGIGTAMTTMSLVLLIVTAVLTGATLTLTRERWRIVRAAGGAHWIIGGSLVGIAGGGCASCGLPVLALLGLSGAAASLPFGGTELSVIAIALLFVSLFVLLKDALRESVCTVPVEKK